MDMSRPCSSLRRVEPEVIVFNDPRKRKKVEQHERDTASTEVRNDAASREPVSGEVSFKKLRYEVMKLGMSNLDKDKYQDAKVAFAVSLGAKPPKKKYMNYKELQEHIKQCRKQKDEQKYSTMASSVKAPKKNRVRKNNKNAVKGFDYQVGHYKNGVQVIPKKEIISSKKNVRRKR